MLISLMGDAGLTQVTRPGTVIWRSRGQRSIIDLTFVSENLTDKVIECGPKEDACHGSDHLPVVLTLDMRPLYTLPTPKHAWHKMDDATIV